jgi:hypothetical protein
VFLDESGVNIDLSRRYGRSIGQKRGGCKKSRVKMHKSDDHEEKYSQEQNFSTWRKHHGTASQNSGAVAERSHSPTHSK